MRLCAIIFAEKTTGWCVEWRAFHRVLADTHLDLLDLIRDSLQNVGLANWNQIQPVTSVTSKKGDLQSNQLRLLWSRMAVWDS